MTLKEISELRRRFNVDKTNIGLVRGCFVNEKREIISRFSESLHLMAPSDKEKMISILKRSLSGTIGKNLIDLSFSTAQVVDSEEHRLLSGLVSSRLKDDIYIEELFTKVISSADIEGSYMILLCNDIYDVPYKDLNGEGNGESDNVHSYIVCSICPIKLTKPELSYIAFENRFESCAQNTVVSAPVIGFTFPAFDDRATNIYNVMYYTKNTKLTQDSFIDTLFNVEPPLPADSQKAVFNDLLVENLQEECSYETICTVNEQLVQYIEEQKEINKDPHPLVTERVLDDLLTGSGISPQTAQAVVDGFKERFGDEPTVIAGNLMDKKQELLTPDIKITLNPDCGDVIKTRIIDGTPYIMVRVTGGVELNGVPLKI